MEVFTRIITVLKTCVDWLQFPHTKLNNSRRFHALSFWYGYDSYVLVISDPSCGSIILVMDYQWFKPDNYLNFILNFWAWNQIDPCSHEYICKMLQLQSNMHNATDKLIAILNTRTGQSHWPSPWVTIYIFLISQ